MDYRNLLYERDDRCVTITLNRPERRNCLSSELLAELDDALRSTGADNEVAGVVLAANGCSPPATTWPRWPPWARPSCMSCSPCAPRP